MPKKGRTKKDLEEFSKRVQEHIEREKKAKGGALLSDIILGGQDGLVNVLGIVLGVASATNDRYLVIIAGLVATFAESVSMAAVAYSSVRAEQDHYRRELEQEKWEIEHLPEIEREEIKLIYMRKGLRGRELAQMVKSVTKNKELWLSVMMSEELGLSPIERSNPVKAALIVGVSAIIGSIIPLIPFFFFQASESIAFSLIISTLSLFAFGAYKAKVTVGNWFKSGIEMVSVGMAAAIVGYLVGKLLGDWVGLQNLA
ncbi:MAG: VIT1/CCC1 transporter family protein, partial [Candidatus Anstonellaceae archaeon]